MKQIELSIDIKNISLINFDVDLLCKKVHNFLETTNDIYQVKKVHDLLLKLAQSYGEIIILMDPKIKKALLELNRKDKQTKIEAD